MMTTTKTANPCCDEASDCVLLDQENNNDDDEDDRAVITEEELDEEKAYDSDLLNLLRVDNAPNSASIQTSVEMDALNDLYLREHLSKVLVHLDLARLRLVKRVKEAKNNSDASTSQLIVRVANAREDLNASSGSSSGKTPLIKTAEDDKEPTTTQTGLVLTLADEAWDNFERMRQVYSFEVSFVFIGYSQGII